MKQSIVKNIVLCTALVTIASSCGKSFLDQDVPGKLPVDEYYKTDQDAEYAITAVYDMSSADYYTAWGSRYMIKMLPSDESAAGGSGPGDQPGYQALDKLATLDPSNSNMEVAWRVAYYTVYRANLVINNVKPESDKRKRIIAEAKALRAYTYLDLVSLWGDVPLILTEVKPEDYTKGTRAPKAEVYAQIEKDLTEAIPDLPLKSAYSLAERYRVSKGTAQSLLGKALLYQEKWADAATQFEAVINSGVYGLEKSIAYAFSPAGEFGKESIFESSFSSAEKYNWGNFPWGNQPESNIHIQIMGPRGDYYTKATADSLIAGWGFNLPTKKMYDAFEAGDERRKYSVMSEAELKAGGGNWTAPTAYDYTGYFQRKYGTFQKNTVDVNELNYTTNFRLIRYADVLLMAAEANYRAGNETKARAYIKLVRDRSHMPEVTASGSALFAAIVHERQVELAFEGFRYIDLVRWGMAATELAASGFTPNRNEVLPIPINDVRTGGLSQNQNY
ncbi:RagB/SusD family nutrient uptake outer membrane protein [Solitalea sp. MAHUQ-68]|uniref:RagB/SusD family nutrient uptake outer membrane protein n=1 Tax=Solitalea agri TaxID=2953739 RepID=A0A9X2EZB7_9SPHI|nr:RagB/SusD family nutrient uptake outer membrane protein [Solitalea agri]MCO4291809.1 RagB/SusD family nutrient uptake outer membrane protein [Solitalea agri]